MALSSCFGSLLDGLDIRRRLSRLGAEALPCLAHVGLSEVVLCRLLGGAATVQASAGLHALAALDDGGPGGFDCGALHASSFSAIMRLARSSALACSHSVV